VRDHGRCPSCAYVVWLCVHGDESASAPAWGRRRPVARPDEALTYPPPPHHHTRRRGLPAIRLHAELSAQFVAFEALRIDGQELSWAPHGEAMPLGGAVRRARPTDPWALWPETTDVALANERFTAWTEAPGMGG
jgi:hypothetical protein